MNKKQLLSAEERRRLHSDKISKKYRDNRDKMNKEYLDFIISLVYGNEEVLNEIRVIDPTISNNKMKIYLFDLLFKYKDELFDF
jgi:hypothetical protein